MVSPTTAMDGTPRAAELDAGDLTVICHVRAPMLLEPVDAHVETLQACAADGQVDELVLRSWPGEVTRAPETPERDVLDRFESFRSWADQAGVDVQPPFETRTRRSIVTGAETDLLVLPLICVALYDDAGGLVGVYPHSVDGETYTVEDAVARLRTGEAPVPLSATPSRVERGDVCPECRGLLVNAQDVSSCPDCGWVGTVGADGQDEALLPDRSGGPVEVSVAPGAGSDSDVAVDAEETERGVEAATTVADTDDDLEVEPDDDPSALETSPN